MPKPKTLFAKRLCELRTEKGYTQRELAAKAGLGENLINTYENGANPSIESVRQIALVLGVSVGFLFGETDIRVPTSESDLTEDQSHVLQLWRSRDWIALMSAVLKEAQTDAAKKGSKS